MQHNNDDDVLKARNCGSIFCCQIFFLHIMIFSPFRLSTNPPIMSEWEGNGHPHRKGTIILSLFSGHAELLAYMARSKLSNVLYFRITEVVARQRQRWSCKAFPSSRMPCQVERRVRCWNTWITGWIWDACGREGFRRQSMLRELGTWWLCYELMTVRGKSRIHIHTIALACDMERCPRASAGPRRDISAIQSTRRRDSLSWRLASWLIV